MDTRDLPIWQRLAHRVYSERQRNAIEAAAYPYMEERDRHAIMERLRPMTDQEEQEAEYKRNRQEAKAFFEARRKGRR